MRAIHRSRALLHSSAQLFYRTGSNFEPSPARISSGRQHKTHSKAEQRAQSGAVSGDSSTVVFEGIGQDGTRCAVKLKAIKR